MNPRGKRAKGGPRNSWRRSKTKEMTKAGYTWHDLARNAQNRVRWKKNCQWPMLFKIVDRRIEDVGKGGSWRSEGSNKIKRMETKQYENYQRKTFERRKTKRSPVFNKRLYSVYLKYQEYRDTDIWHTECIEIHFKISTPQSTVYEIKTIMRMLR